MLDEVEGRMWRLARTLEEETAMRDLWHRFYRGHLRVIEPEDLHDTRLDELREQDPSDLGLCALTLTLDHPLLLTSENLLVNLGFAPGPWLQPARDAHDVVTYDATMQSAAFAMQLTATAVGALASATKRGSAAASFTTVGLAALLLWTAADREARSKAARGAVRLLCAAGALQTRRDHAAEVLGLSRAVAPRRR